MTTAAERAAMDKELQHRTILQRQKVNRIANLLLDEMEKKIAELREIFKGTDKPALDKANHILLKLPSDLSILEEFIAEHNS